MAVRTAVARLSSRYQLVVPRAVRECLALRPDSQVLFVIDGDLVILRPQPENFTDTLSGLHKELWKDADQWLREERATWE